MPLYREAHKLFGMDLAMRLMKKKTADSIFFCDVKEWWTQFGGLAPNLHKLAIIVLSLTCSACGYERNWSMIEHISLGLLVF